MTVLFSPLGFSYGWLYSAILLVRPQRLVVVTSVQASANLHSTLDAARFYHTNFEFHAQLMDDPLAGFSEGRALSRLLAASAADDNIVNLTGGTTVLQDCARSIAEVLREQNKNVREIAVIDRRDADEQKRVPFALGELVEVPPL